MDVPASVKKVVFAYTELFFRKIDVLARNRNKPKTTFDGASSENEKQDTLT